MRVGVRIKELCAALELLIRYGLWAQDRYKKRRCASAEGQYRAPPTPGEEPMPALMADFAATELGVTFPASFQKWEGMQVDPDTGEIIGGTAL